MVTFDDAINQQNYELYMDLFNDQRRNPNGCPIRGENNVILFLVELGMVYCRTFVRYTCILDKSSYRKVATVPSAVVEFPPLVGGEGWARKCGPPQKTANIQAEGLRPILNNHLSLPDFGHPL